MVPVTRFKVDPSGRVHRICEECETIRKVTIARTDWDWASAISKSRHLHSYHKDTPGAEYSELLTPVLLRVIMQLQKSCCLISGVPFYLPKPGVLSRKQTLTAWTKTLISAEAQCVPVLVRNDSALKWEAGNVFFICTRWLPIYESYGTLARLLTALRTVVTAMPSIPSHADVIAAYHADVEQKLKQQ